MGFSYIFSFDQSIDIGFIQLFQAIYEPFFNNPGRNGQAWNSIQ